MATEVLEGDVERNLTNTRRQSINQLSTGTTVGRSKECERAHLSLFVANAPDVTLQGFVALPPRV